MIQKKETLSKEVIDKLSTQQNKINNALLQLGQAELKLLKLQKEIEVTKAIKMQLESDYDKIDAEFTEIIKDLEKQYPNGEVDLLAGTVIYESAE